MPNWIEETKKTANWISPSGKGWFSSWFVNGWFSGDAAWIEEIKKTANWIEE